MIRPQNSSVPAKALLLCLVSLTLLTAEALAAKGSGGGNGTGTVADPFQARGTFPTNTNSGQCVMPATGSVVANIQTQAVLRRSQGIWQFTIETIGSNSEGYWDIRFSNNSTFGVPTSMSFQPPGGWAVVGANLSSKGIYRITGQATKTSSFTSDTSSVGTVCTVVIDLTI